MENGHWVKKQPEFLALSSLPGLVLPVSYEGPRVLADPARRTCAYPLFPQVERRRANRMMLETQGRPRSVLETRDDLCARDHRGEQIDACPEKQADTLEQGSSEASVQNGDNKPFTNTARSQPLERGNSPRGKSLVLAQFLLLVHWRESHRSKVNNGRKNKKVEKPFLRFEIMPN